MIGLVAWTLLLIAAVVGWGKAIAWCVREDRAQRMLEDLDRELRELTTHGSDSGHPLRS
ncbi:MAG TPA: hypothetical protein VGH10_00090 [Actinomycetota bacterium]|jgi:hypothetical protein